MSGTLMRHDVVVVGDGPAGSVLAAALRRRHVDVALVGTDAPWSATYGTWSDDVDRLDWLGDASVWAHRFDSIAVDAGGARDIRRGYGVIDNVALRTLLRRDLVHLVASVVSIDDTNQPGGADRAGHIVRLADGTTIEARLVIDATGWPGLGAHDTDHDDVARQTAFGVVLAEPPAGPLGVPTLMDFSATAEERTDHLGPSFGYALPVADGWLVEETVLAAHPAIPPAALESRLADRLGWSVDQLRSAATRTELVEIPMGGPIPDRSSSVVAFGAAAGLIHPATGYSISTSLTLADPMASAIGVQLSAPAIDHSALWDVLWSPAARRTRGLHDYGLQVILDLDADDTRAFFSTFFDLDPDQWASYLRVTTAPTRMTRIMMAMLVRSSWRIRRRLVSQNPRTLLRLIRGLLPIR